MWGGRFEAGPDAVMEEINASIGFDWQLFRQDIAGSKAHAAMLAKQGIITAEDGQTIAHGLDSILSEIEAGDFEFSRALEDIHMNVEARLTGPDWRGGRKIAYGAVAQRSGGDGFQTVRPRCHRPD